MADRKPFFRSDDPRRPVEESPSLEAHPISFPVLDFTFNHKPYMERDLENE